MFNQRMLARQMLKFSLAGVVAILCVTNAQAEEQRCKDLGANCICSEPLNTPTYVNVSSGQWFNPADSTVKECSSSGAFPGAALESGSGWVYQTTSSGEAINNLPPGHTNSFVLRTNDGRGGQAIGGKYPSGTPTARRVVRFYKYYSSNYSFVNEVSGCLNSNKIAQAGFNGALTGGPMFTETAGTWSFYDIEQSLYWNMNANGCCENGPGGTGPSLASIKGKWIRYEFVIHNAAVSGPATTWEVFLKNVTDNTPEMKIIDSSVPTAMTDGINWTTALATSLHPTREWNELSIDLFRNGTCTGFAGVSYYMTAAWSTDAGQRIGAAAEIEGSGGTGNIPPPAPANLRVSMLIGQ